MAFNNIMQLATATLVKQNAFPSGATVVEWGNQRFRYTPKWIEKCTETSGCTIRQPVNFVWEYFEDLNFQEYLAIDINTELRSVAMDLNFILRDKYNYTQTFDLVTNNGTSEHCFNQLTCFKNIHDLCVSGGLMIHVLPVGGYENHGLYNYHPTFFYNLAAANHYKVLGIYLSTNKTVDDSLWVLPGLIPYQTNLISSLEQYSGNSDMG